MGGRGSMHGIFLLGADILSADLLIEGLVLAAWQALRISQTFLAPAGRAQAQTAFSRPGIATQQAARMQGQPGFGPLRPTYPYAQPSPYSRAGIGAPSFGQQSLAARPLPPQGGLATTSQLGAAGRGADNFQLAALYSQVRSTISIELDSAE